MTSRLIATLKHQETDRPPVWLMRQAGRFHPEYRELRAQHPNFMSFCYNSQAASRATMIPINSYPELDAAIIFSDILVIPQALGMDVTFQPGKGPLLDGNLDPHAWRQAQDTNTLAPVYEAIKLTRAQLPYDKSLIGFCGAPWTLLAYMLNSRNQHEFAKARMAAIAFDEQYQMQLEIVTEAVISHAERQIAAGADVIMLFDSWAGLLGEQAFLNSVIAPLQKITNRLKAQVPVIVFMRASAQHLQHWQEVPATAYGVDFATSMQKVHTVLPDAILQGNIDPAILLGNHDVIEQAVQNLLQLPFNDQLILNLGHGVLPQTKPEAISVLLNTLMQTTRA